MLNRITFIVIAAATALLFTCLDAPVVSAASVRDRMIARIPEINVLKDQGKVGENNRGYLEYRSQDKPQAQLVSGENKDRKSVYNAIAKKQKVDAVLVGQRRAKQIADKGQRGHWFQKPDGSWYKK